MLRFSQVSFSYPRARIRRHRAVPVLSGLSFSAEAGRILFVLGPNGSGKSTLFRLVLGLLRTRHGSVGIDGDEVSKLSSSEIARRVSYIPQEYSVNFNFTVRQSVLMGRTAHMGTWSNRLTGHDHELAQQAMATMGIEGLAERGIRDLSGGERQLTLIARALCQRSRILILDEPTSNLDYGNQDRVLEELRRLADLGFLVAVSTHNPMHALHYGDDLLLLRQGQRIAFSPPQDVTESQLTALYDSPIRLISSPEAPGLRICLPARSTISSGGIPT